MTQEIHEGRNYSTLKSIVQTPQIKMTTFGVILDATGTYKTDDSFDYVCKLKIIDETLHPQTSNKKSKNKILPYIQVFMFSHKIAQSPKISTIGDIFYLEDFSFDTYQETLVRGTFKKYSKWGLLDGFSQDYIFKFQSGYLELTSQQKDRVKDLRAWIKSFFSQKPITKLDWFKCKDFSEHFTKQKMIYESVDIDLIVKVVAFSKSVAYQNAYTKIIFVDEKLREYFSEIKNLKINLEKNMIVKLRSVSVQSVKNTYAIEFSNYSEILLIPKFFNDAVKLLKKTENFVTSKNNLETEMKNEFHLEKYQKEQINQYTTIYRTKNQKADLKLLQEFEYNFQILKEFDLSNPQSMNSVAEQFGSLTMSKHIDMQVTSLSALSQKLKKLQSKKKTPSIEDNQAFKIRVHLEDVKIKKLKDMIRIFNRDNAKVLGLQELWKLKGKSFDHLELVLQNEFVVSDVSLKKDEKVNIILSTADNNPNFIFDLWQILPQLRVEEFSSAEKLAQYEEVFEESIDQLLSDQKKNLEFEVIVETYREMEGKYLFRMIDTIFWFVTK